MTIEERAEALRLPESSLSAVLKRLFAPTEESWREIPQGGGNISEACVLELPDGKRFFLKRKHAVQEQFFVWEAAGLLALREPEISGIYIPRPLAIFEDQKCSCLLMEYIDVPSFPSSPARDFGAALARLHRTSRARRYGFYHDNVIGATTQINQWQDNWYTFFGEQRLLVQARWAWEAGRGDNALYRSVEQIVHRLPELLPPVDHGGSSLLHGDLWGGNVLFPGDGTAVLIDPAVYFGHREADLAMTSLFGGFSPDFYRSYQEEWPLEPGFDERRDIYNLYHLLNHLNLFGTNYRSSCEAIVRRFR
jgi:fructosamine-3-kinase